MVRKEETDTLRRVVAELEASKETVQGEYDTLRGEVETLKDRLESTAQTLAQAQQEVTDTQQEKEEMKRQRDVAMQRALSRGKSQTPGPEVDQLRVDKEAAEQERDRLAQAMEQLRKDMGDLKDDVEYERTEKTKAREERDKIRENARTLERRTSQALRTTDALHSLKRELSSSQMRVQDYESMVTELKADNDALRRQLEEQQPSPRSLEATASAKDDEMTQMVNELVEAKMAVAQAMAERQQLEFELQQMRKEERAMQQRLATKASRLEVRLESANQEIERLRSYGGGIGSGSGSAMGRRHSTAVPKSHDAREFNELGSDVDY